MKNIYKYLLIPSLLIFSLSFCNNKQEKESNNNSVQQDQESNQQTIHQDGILYKLDMSAGNTEVNWIGYKTNEKTAVSGSFSEFSSDRKNQSFNSIDDLVDGLILAALKKKAINQTFNLTYGNSRPIIDLIKILKNNFDNVKVVKKSREAFMPERGTLDISKAQDLLNYSPQNPIETGYQKYIEWYKKFFNENS